MDNVGGGFLGGGLFFFLREKLDVWRECENKLLHWDHELGHVIHVLGIY